MSSQSRTYIGSARRWIVPLTFVFSFSVAAFPTLDTTFGDKGFVEHAVAGEIGVASRTQVLPDGQLVAAGNSYHLSRGKGGFPIYTFFSQQYLLTGALSPAVIPQGDSGNLFLRDGTWITLTATGLARFNPNGLPLPSFITDGAASIPWYSEMIVGGLAEQADGKIVIAGNANQNVVMARFNQDGSLDPSFNQLGALVVPHGAADIDSSEFGLVIQPDGKFLVATSSGFGVGAEFEFTAIRVNANGSMDSTFGVNGKSIVAFDDTFQDYVRTIALQPNGRVILGGSHGDAAQIVGLRGDNGALDMTFGAAGVIRIPTAHDDSTFQLHSVLVQPDGTLVVSVPPAPSGATGRLMRFRADGNADVSFGIAGTFTSASLKSVDGIALQDDGDLFIGGTSAAGNFAVLRLINGPSAAIEYYNAALDHYFLTANVREVAALDLGIFGGWQRTGLAIPVYGSLAAANAADISSTHPVCRFYIPPVHGDSHFLSADPFECQQALALSVTEPSFSGYVEETGNAFYVGLPTRATGSCPAGTMPVYRLWNARFDSNHRYTTDLSVRAQMEARGYIAEGVGPGAVSMCAPQVLSH